MNGFCEGEYIVYRNNEKYELGRITSLREDGAFVCYHEGETAAKTPYDHMHKLINKHVIRDTSLGGGRFLKPDCERERKMGEWICSDDLYETAVCSCCGWDTTDPWVHIKNWFAYCPHCGAYMGDKQE